jgi:hypothetical protein
MKVAVTGGRSFSAREVVYLALSRANKRERITFVLHGACPSGVDAHAAAWAMDHGVEHSVRTYAADWDKYGKAAGPIRNREMLTTEKPDLVLVFPGGRGTRDCELQARKLGLNVELVATGYDATGRLLPVKDEG